MSWFTKMMSSSLGRKYIMGITGLLLCGFLIAHLAGNFLLFVGAEAYNAYAHKLHEQVVLLKIAEGGLIALFAIHIYLAISLTIQNRAARGPRGYAVKEHKDGAENTPLLAGTWMFWSGAVVLGFMLLHLSQFTWDAWHSVKPEWYFNSADGTTALEPFDKAVAILKHPVTIGGYLVGVIVLGFHVMHGFSSAFRSLGLSHSRYNAAIRIAGYIFGAFIAVGFGSFLLWARFK